jgi:F0F1-type ATP synthase membrane subunit c/vacuolar-type H+-ATPase subunit K
MKSGPMNKQDSGYVGLGVALGAAFGVAMGNLAIGIAIGVAIGAGMAAKKRNDGGDEEQADSKSE